MHLSKYVVTPLLQSRQSLRILLIFLLKTTEASQLIFMIFFLDQKKAYLLGFGNQTLDEIYISFYYIIIIYNQSTIPCHAFIRYLLNRLFRLTVWFSVQKKQKYLQFLICQTWPQSGRHILYRFNIQRTKNMKYY